MNKKRKRAQNIAIILAAGRGKRLGKLGKKYPKCLLPIFGKYSLLEDTIMKLNRMVDKIIIVGGYKIECICSFLLESSYLSKRNISLVYNTDYMEPSNLYSLKCAMDFIKYHSNGDIDFDSSNVFILDGDTYYSEYLLCEIINKNNLNNNYIYTSNSKNYKGEWKVKYSNNKLIVNKNPKNKGDITTGIVSVSKSDFRKFANLVNKADVNKYKYWDDIYSDKNCKIKFKAKLVKGYVKEIDHLSDYKNLLYDLYLRKDEDFN